MGISESHAALKEFVVEELFEIGLFSDRDCKAQSRILPIEYLDFLSINNLTMYTPYSVAGLDKLGFDKDGEYRIKKYSISQGESKLAFVIRVFPVAVAKCDSPIPPMPWPEAIADLIEGYVAMKRENRVLRLLTQVKQSVRDLDIVVKVDGDAYWYWFSRGMCYMNKKNEYGGSEMSVINL